MVTISTRMPQGAVTASSAAWIFWLRTSRSARIVSSSPWPSTSRSMVWAIRGRGRLVILDLDDRPDRIDHMIIDNGIHIHADVVSGDDGLLGHVELPDP